MRKAKRILRVALIAASAASLTFTAGTASAWPHRRAGYPSFNALRILLQCTAARSLLQSLRLWRLSLWWDRYEACTG